jgi:hypothetical protein
MRWPGAFALFDCRVGGPHFAKASAAKNYSSAPPWAQTLVNQISFVSAPTILSVAPISS